MRLLPPQQKQQKPNMYKDIALYVVYSKTEHIFDTDLESHTCFASSVSFSSYAVCNLILTYFALGYVVNAMENCTPWNSNSR